MPEVRSAYEVLAIPRTASEEQIRFVCGRVQMEAHAEGKELSDELRAACHALYDPVNRRHYQALLIAACKGRAIPLPPEQVDEFQGFCESVRVQYREHPLGSERYYVWFDGQALPAALRETESPLHRSAGGPITFGGAAGYLFRQVFLFRLFRQSGNFVRFLLIVGYALAFFGLFSAARYSADMAQVWVHHITRAKEQAEREALHDAIARTCDTASLTLDEMNDAVGTMRSQFEQLTHVHIDDAATMKTTRPADVDTALLRHPSMRQAWSDIVNARPSPAELERAAGTISRTRQRLNDGILDQADQVELVRLTDWAKEKTARVRGQGKNIDHIRVMMSADGFETSLDKDRRSVSP